MYEAELASGRSGRERERDRRRGIVDTSPVGTDGAVPVRNRHEDDAKASARQLERARAVGRDDSILVRDRDAGEPTLPRITDAVAIRVDECDAGDLRASARDSGNREGDGNEKAESASHPRKDARRRRLRYQVTGYS
jgi:hypothetical protein